MSFQLAIGAIVGAVATVFLFMGGLSFIEPGEFGVPAPLYNLLKDIIGPVAAGFGGAISGAFVSYRYQQENERKLTLRNEAKEYNRSMGLLAFKLNDIASIKLSAILPYEDDPLRFITIPAVAYSHPREERATDTLSDILIGRGEDELLPVIFEAEERYHSVRESFYERARLISGMREKTESFKEGRDRLISLDTIVGIHGAGATIRMYHLTEQVISGVDDAVEGLINALIAVGAKCGSKIKKSGETVIGYAKDKNDAYRRTASPYFKDADYLEDCIKGGSNSQDSYYSHRTQRTSYKYRSDT